MLEAKQGSAGKGAEDHPLLPGVAPGSKKAKRGTAVRGTEAWTAAMLKAKAQAERYVRALPAGEGNPPFVVVVDVGHTIELYADFSRLGKTYTPFPDPLTHRLRLADLARPEVRGRLAKVWTDPLSLDPSRHSAKVTRDVAAKLAKVARSLEASGHHPELVAEFLMRCLFTFFAEDARLIDRTRPDEQPFTQLLRELRATPDQFVPMVQDVWARMNAGGFSVALRRHLKHFNGGLFEQNVALPLSAGQLDLLIEAGAGDWSDVEPAIFGTLLERALDERERHKLGAHYTPRAYVERLVLPAVIEPLRERFDAARAAAFTLSFQGKPEDARKAVADFLLELCNTTVLDPACGSGNFLYVTMEHMKRLEGEARDLLRQLGETQADLERSGRTVDPHQFLGLELNPRAVAIAELVLWIGYLKWHLRTLGHAPAEPLLRDFHNIVEQDAVLAYDGKELVTDEQGKPVTRWNGRTMKVSPVTGEEVPDEAARTPVYRYVNPRKAEWPKADYVVGNPPFIGGWKIRQALGDGYVEALWSAYDDVPEKADFVMYWWDKAAREARAERIHRFGLITTNSVTQVFQRRVLQHHLDGTRPLRLRFAVPDHPWVDGDDAAAVRVAMTVGEAGEAGTEAWCLLGQVCDDGEDEEHVSINFKRVSNIGAALQSGANTAATIALRSNDGICSPGVQLYGMGFVLEPGEASDLGPAAQRGMMAGVLRRYLNGKDMMANARGAFVIDFFGMTKDEAAREHPALYQRVLDRVKPEREQNRRASIRDNWWRFGWERPVWRAAVKGLQRFITTPEVAKHRVFVFLSADYLPDNRLTNFALQDTQQLGVLSSRFHGTWALAVGGRLEDRPVYTKASCFDPFPFPAPTDAEAQRIRELGESLDAHRKRQQAAHPGLTITDMYNVLEKLRRAEPLTDKDRRVHEQGLVSVLRQIHDDLDAAVAGAYGWPADLGDDEVLRRLVALNAERAAEERRGLVRWLRPDFQNPDGAAAAAATTPTQGELTLPDPMAGPAKAGQKPAWPKTLPEQAAALRAALAASATPATADDLARRFRGARADRVAELLATLALLGQARATAEGRFAA